MPPTQPGSKEPGVGERHWMSYGALGLKPAEPLVVVPRSERDSAQHFAGFGAANGQEMAQRIIARRQCRVADAVGNLYQFVRVGASIAIGADRRSDGKDRYSSCLLYTSDAADE